MGIPATLGTSSQLLRSMKTGDAQKALRLATIEGKKRIKRILASQADPCAEAIRAWDGKVEGRVQGTRAMCRFAALPESRVAILDLRLETGGWRLEDVAAIESSVYEGFGRPDPSSTPPSN